jgi:hypothetical protein
MHRSKQHAQCARSESWLQCDQDIAVINVNGIEGVRQCLQR